MSTTWKATFVLVLVAVCGIAGLETWLVHQRKIVLAAVASHVSQLEAEARRAQAERDRAQHDLESARAAAAKIEAEITPQLLPPEQRQAWLTRTRALKRLFVIRPDQAIPELRLLDEQTWLLVAKNARLDSEDGIRKALARLRALAKSPFVAKLDAALRSYTKQSGGQLPADIAQLIPFMDTPPDPAMLQRYRMTRTGSVVGRPTDWAIEENDLIDPDNDSHFHVQASGGYGAGSGAGAEFSGSVQRAARAFREANGREVENPQDLAAYFDPPLDAARQQRFAAFVEKMQAAQKARNAPSPTK